MDYKRFKTALLEASKQLSQNNTDQNMMLIGDLTELHKYLEILQKLGFNFEDRKTLIPNWIKYLQSKGIEETRLYNILYSAYNDTGFCFIEDIQKKDFIRLRNAGKGSWERFEDLYRKHPAIE